MADDNDKTKGPESPDKPKAPPPPPPAPPKKEKPPDPLKRVVESVPMARLQEVFAGVVDEPIYHAGQVSVVVPAERLVDIAMFLRDDEESRCDFLMDLCAVDYPDRDKRFEVNYQLFSVQHLHLLRLKVSAAEDEALPSMTSVWSTANWFEREVFDLFGIPFEGHPDLRRILLPEHWRGHPLRKEYPLAGFPDLHLRLR